MIAHPLQLTLRIIVLASFSFYSFVIEAKESFTPCVPIAGQWRKVPMPSELGNQLINEESKSLGPEMVARVWKSTHPDPNKLYITYAFDLNGDGIDEYLIRTNPVGQSAFGKNNLSWIFRRRGDSYEAIMEDFAKINGGPIVLQSVTNHYHDICVIQQGGAMDRTEIILRINPKSSWYEKSECRTIVYDYAGNPQSITITACK